MISFRTNLIFYFLPTPDLSYCPEFYIPTPPTSTFPLHCVPLEIDLFSRSYPKIQREEKYNREKSGENSTKSNFCRQKDRASSQRAH
ncbi:hypothetical protein CEXT_496291 [Caerostris extrusa]|uniref:Uncharacterized protein n=1 Tax=Caerostris extrusa TaxID=172846 RepID=A0AAV4Y987_CAEEX|nr:hypothetical protein CEXT_496291 [Caerostris extrusa]